MIECQRQLFEMDENVTYLNCAYTSPLLKSARAAGEAAVRAKTAPWRITPANFFETLERNRSLMGRLLDCDPDSVAVIPAVSYGISLAARNLPAGRGRTIVMLKDQFPSNVYPWQRKAAETGARIVVVPRPADGRWTAAVLDAIDERTAVAALPNCHWTDGGLIDLVAVSRRLREVGAALVVDATQSAGAMPFSIRDVQPDVFVTTAHKWLLGPYSYGFCYVAPQWHDGVPLEENWMNREGSEDFSRLVDYRDGYQSGARRYDVGEASNFILSPVAGAALEQILTWGVNRIAEALAALTGEIADLARQRGFHVPPADVRAPHLIGISLPGGLPRDLVARLAAEQVYVSVRGDAIRIAPHLYNTSDDAARLFQVLDRSGIGIG